MQKHMIWKGELVVPTNTFLTLLCKDAESP